MTILQTGREKANELINLYFYQINNLVILYKSFD